MCYVDDVAELPDNELLPDLNGERDFVNLSPSSLWWRGALTIFSLTFSPKILHLERKSVCY